MAAKLSFIKKVCNKVTLLELIKIYKKNNLTIIETLSQKKGI